MEGCWPGALPLRRPVVFHGGGGVDRGAGLRFLDPMLFGAPTGTHNLLVATSVAEEGIGRGRAALSPLPCLPHNWNLVPKRAAIATIPQCVLT